MRPLLVLLVLGGAAVGQSYRLGSAVVDEAGRRTAGTGYVLQFSLCQTLASGWLAGPDYRAVIGFWHGPCPPGSIAGGSAPDALLLSLQAAPSLVSHRTTIRYVLPGESAVVLRVLDHLGAVVGVLVQGRLAPGAYRACWDIGTASRTRLPNGVYFLQLVAGDRALVEKVVVAR